MASVNSPQASSRFSRFSKAECVLVLITMIWGGTFLLVQHAMTVSGPMFFVGRSEEHTSELQSLMRISYAVFCLKKKNIHHTIPLTVDYNLQTPTPKQQHNN